MPSLCSESPTHLAVIAAAISGTMYCRPPVSSNIITTNDTTHTHTHTQTHTHTSLIITPRKSQLNGCPPLFSSSNTTQNPECNMISMISLQCFAAGMYMPFFASYYPDHHMQQQQQPLFNGPFLGLPRWAGTRKVKTMWILLKQETASGSGIS